MSIHRMIVEIREKHPLLYEGFSREQKQRLLDKCIEGKTVKQAWKEVRNETRKTAIDKQDSR